MIQILRFFYNSTLTVFFRDAFNNRTLAFILPHGLTSKPFDFLPVRDIDCILVQVVSKSPVPSNPEQFYLLDVSVIPQGQDTKLPLGNSSAPFQRLKLALKNEAEVHEDGSILHQVLNWLEKPKLAC